MSRTSKAAAEKSMPAGLKTRNESRNDSLSGEKPASKLTVAKLLGLRGTSQAMIGVGSGEVRRLERARIATPLGREHIGRDVVVLFEHGQGLHPLVIGVVAPWPAPEPAGATMPLGDMVIDGERLVFHAQQEVVLTCGKASLTLTRAGKVLIRGTYLSSRSSGVHRIKGGSVQVN